MVGITYREFVTLDFKIDFKGINTREFCFFRVSLKCNKIKVR